MGVVSRHLVKMDFGPRGENGSHPGFWRSKSGNLYRRSPSLYRLKSRELDSNRKDKNRVTLAGRVSKIENEVGEIKADVKENMKDMKTKVAIHV